MEKEVWVDKKTILQAPFEIVELLYGFKQIALIIKFSSESGEIFGMYRPEDGLKISIESSIPIPRELYLDCAFSKACNLLGWDFAPPVFPWEIPGESKGVIRPYWKHVGHMQKYHFAKERLLTENSDLWKKIAVADYIFGVCDRVNNDFLVTTEGVKVVDSGYSFLSGLDFTFQHSVVREALFGVTLENDKEILSSLRRGIPEIVEKLDYLTEDDKRWVLDRTNKILEIKMII